MNTCQNTGFDSSQPCAKAGSETLVCQYFYWFEDKGSENPASAEKMQEMATARNFFIKFWRASDCRKQLSIPIFQSRKDFCGIQDFTQLFQRLEDGLGRFFCYFIKSNGSKQIGWEQMWLKKSSRGIVKSIAN